MKAYAKEIAKVHSKLMFCPRGSSWFGGYLAMSLRRLGKYKIIGLDINKDLTWHRHDVQDIET